MKRHSTMATKRSVDMRRRLENALAGAGSARMEFLKRRQAGLDRSPGGGGGSSSGGGGSGGGGGGGGEAAGGGTRFDKDTWFQTMNDAQNSEARNRDDVGNDAHIEGMFWRWRVLINLCLTLICILT